MMYSRGKLREWVSHWGEIALSAEELADIWQASLSLPLQERQVLALVMRGYTLREISAQLMLGQSATPSRRIFEDALKHMEEKLNGHSARVAR